MQSKKLSDDEVGTLLRTINHLCSIAATHISSKANYNCQLAVQDLVESEHLEHIINQYEPDFPEGHYPSEIDEYSDVEICEALAKFWDEPPAPPRYSNGRYNDRT